jgi:hypothetical protein
MEDGTTLTGEIITFNGSGIKFRLDNDQYTDMIPWTKFSQAGLQTLVQNPKSRAYAEPFLELPPVQKVHAADHIKLREVSRLDRPAPQSLLGALAASSVGKLLLLLIYAANLYAAFELAACRARPVPVVMGLAAVLPVLGPFIFYLLPSMQQGEPAESAPEPEGQEPAPAGTPPAPGTPPATGAPSGTEAPTLEGIQIAAIAPAPSIKLAPVDQVFKRGQFTFNRRFFETKFAGFFPAVRSETDQKLDLIIKLPQGIFVVQRIASIAMNDVNLEILQDEQTQVIQAPFADILEITLKVKSP